MRKLLFTFFIVALLSPSAFSQLSGSVTENSDVKSSKFTVGTGLGIKFPLSADMKGADIGGIDFSLSFHYRISDKFQTGLKLNRTIAFGKNYNTFGFETFMADVIYDIYFDRINKSGFYVNAGPGFWGSEELQSGELKNQINPGFDAGAGLYIYLSPLVILDISASYNLFYNKVLADNSGKESPLYSYARIELFIKYAF
jgi:hypothetical protein